MKRLTDAQPSSGTTGAPSPAPEAASATGLQLGGTGFAGKSMTVASDGALAVARSAAELRAAEVDRRIAALLPRSLVLPSGSLPDEPPEVAPADLRPGDSERLAEWIGGACLPARDLDELTDGGIAMTIAGALARLRAVTVSRKAEGMDQELQADELLSLCLRYPADVALQAITDAKDSERFFPTYADMVTALEALNKRRRLWLDAVEGWPVQIADGRHHAELQRRHDRARRIVRRLQDRRATGGWLPRDDVDLQRQTSSMQRLAKELSDLGLQPLPEGTPKARDTERERIADALHEASDGLRTRAATARKASMKHHKTARGIRVCTCHGLSWKSDEAKPDQCISPRCRMPSHQAEGGQG